MRARQKYYGYVQILSDNIFFRSISSSINVCLQIAEGSESEKDKRSSGKTDLG